MEELCLDELKFIEQADIIHWHFQRSEDTARDELDAQRSCAPHTFSGGACVG